MKITLSMNDEQLTVKVEGKSNITEILGLLEFGKLQITKEYYKILQDSATESETEN